MMLDKGIGDIYSNISFSMGAMFFKGVQKCRSYLCRLSSQTSVNVFLCTKHKGSSLLWSLLCSADLKSFQWSESQNYPLIPHLHWQGKTLSTLLTDCGQAQAQCLVWLITAHALLFFLRGVHLRGHQTRGSQGGPSSLQGAGLQCHLRSIPGPFCWSWVSLHQGPAAQGSQVGSGPGQAP